MKHILKGVMAFAVCVLLVQCRKPNLDGWSHVGHTETIEFTAGYGHDEKGTLETVGAALRYRWDIDNTDGKTDRLLVYAQGGDATTFTSGEYLGSIPIVKVDPTNPCIATFRGVLGKVPEKGVLRFVHVGQDVAVDKGAANISFADQDGSLGTISKKIIAVCDEAYTKIESFNDGKLAIRFAVCKLDMSGFSAAVGNKVDMSCIVHNGVSISAHGTISYTSGTYSNLNGVTAASTQYYIVMMPVNDNTRNIVLSCKDSSGRILTSKDLKASFKANGYYTKPDGEGQPSGEPYKPNVTQSVPGLLSGVFTVGPGKSVHFTQGNLWYNHENAHFSLSNNQLYMYIGPYFDKSRVERFYFGSLWYQAVQMEYIITGKTVLFTNASAEEPKADFEVYVPDNGSVKGLYRVLSKDEIDYMMNTRKVYVNNEAKVPYGLATVSAGDDWQGLVILPDNWDGSVCPGFSYGTYSYSDNRFNSDGHVRWAEMEAAGAVFLPAAGFRWCNDGYNGLIIQISESERRGLYMLSEPVSGGYYYYNFWESAENFGVLTQGDEYAASIRLVCDSDNL